MFLNRRDGAPAEWIHRRAFFQSKCPKPIREPVGFKGLFEDSKDRPDPNDSAVRLVQSTPMAEFMAALASCSELGDKKPGRQMKLIPSIKYAIYILQVCHCLLGGYESQGLLNFREEII